MSYVLTCVHENRGPNQALKPIWIRACRTVYEVNFLVTLGRFIYLASAESVHLFSLFDYFTACRRLREVMISLSLFPLNFVILLELCILDYISNFF